MFIFLTLLKIINLDKESDKDRGEFSEKESYISPNKSKYYSPDLNLKKETAEKEKGNGFLLKETNQNTSSFLSNNEYNQDKNIFTNLKNNIMNYRNNTAIFDVSQGKNNDLNDLNYLNNQNNEIDTKNMSYTKKATELLFNSKKTFVEVNNHIRLNNTPNINPIRLKKENLNTTQLNENVNKLDLEQEDKLNLNKLNKIKSTSNLPNFSKQRNLNASNIQKINDNYSSNINYYRLNFAETPNAEKLLLENNIYNIKEGKYFFS